MSSSGSRPRHETVLQCLIRALLEANIDIDSRAAEQLKTKVLQEGVKGLEKVLRDLGIDIKKINIVISAYEKCVKSAESFAEEEDEEEKEESGEEESRRKGRATFLMQVSMLLSKLCTSLFNIPRELDDIEVAKLCVEKIRKYARNNERLQNKLLNHLLKKALEDHRLRLKLPENCRTVLTKRGLEVKCDGETILLIALDGSKVTFKLG